MTAQAEADREKLRKKTCFFTGHRNTPHKQMPEIQAKLETAVIKLINTGVSYYAVGGALGFDTIAALTIIKLKEEYPHIKLVLILPCKNYEFSWQGKSTKLLDGIKEKADRVIYTAERYYNGCMNKRNRLMVEGSNYCICYQTNATGGTAYTVNYAKSLGVKILNLANY